MGHVVYILIDGQTVETGNVGLVNRLERYGFASWKGQVA